MSYNAEYHQCPNCEYRITAECKRSAHPNQPCPNCEELWFRDFKEVPEPREPLSPLSEAVQKAFKRSKERESLIRRYEQMCECGHKSGRHWYAVEHGTASYDCRDCDCLNFILQKMNKADS